jgi:hypothetical protein
MSVQKKDRKFYNRKLHGLSDIICGSDNVLRTEVTQVVCSRDTNSFVCSKCGCTTSNCAKCIEKTGSPCYWVEKDLCSACVEHEKLLEYEKLWEKKSVLLLTDQEAEQLYDKLVPLANNAAKNLNQLKLGAGIKAGALMSVDQRKKIIRILRYVLKWSPQASFEFIITALPEYRKRLTPGEIEKYDLFALYGILQYTHADKIIKRLEKIEDGKKTGKDKKKKQAPKSIAGFAPEIGDME